MRLGFAPSDRPRFAGHATAAIGLLTIVQLFLTGCAATARLPADLDMVDPNASSETSALYANLRRLAPDHVLFGHQDDLAYGVSWEKEEGRSDVLEAAGSYPAVYGWELGDLEHGAEENLDGVNFEDMKRWIRQGYERGGVITMSWHMDNPATGGDSWDTTRAVDAILPGGEKHALYRQWLDRFAAFVGDLHVRRFPARSEPIPIIFRPFHEHTGSWFWWGRGHLSAEEYVQLWRFTVHYLRDEKGLNNLLYAYSTDAVDTPEQYLAFYPGDAYVDILGMDDYGSLRRVEGVDILARRLRLIVELANQRGKVAALSETGLEGVPVSDWWTARLLKAIQKDPVGQGIAYVLVWRNANERQRPGHFYAPHAGHQSEADFRTFYADPFVLFESELPDLYR